MSRNLRRPVEDFAAIFEAISRQKEPVVLVGGHAVNVWALSYQDRIGSELAPMRPLTSGDMDLYATRNTLMGLHEALGGKLILSGPREITDGTLIIGVEPETRELDVLRSVHGIPKIEAQDTISLEVCGHVVPVLFPHLLMQAKLANAARLDQKDRQDVKHVKIMGLVLREFLRDVVMTASPENEKAALVLMRRTVEILTSKDARDFARRHGARLSDIVPTSEMKTSLLRKLRSFAMIELPRMLPKAGERRG